MNNVAAVDPAGAHRTAFGVKGLAQIRIAIGILALMCGLLVTQTSAFAAGTPFCSPGAAPRFVFGFAALKDQLGATMGDPVECEHANPDNGDTLQATTAGLSFYRKSTNTPTFTDGNRHWGMTSAGLVAWIGSSVDPPGGAVRASGPPAAAAAPAAPSTPRYSYPVVEAPSEVEDINCLRANPSCGREEWWAEWNDLQGDESAASGLVQYRFLGPGLVTERRYIEVVWLLWRWSEGRALLRDAADNGLIVATISPDGLKDAFAAYSPRHEGIVVNRRFTETSTWMIADVLAHELKHAADDRAGIMSGPDFASCVGREQRAYLVESRYLRWLAGRFNQLPGPNLVKTNLSSDDFGLYSNLYEIGTSPNVADQAYRDYREHCAR